MSLINQMLQDLDARGSDGVGATAAHSQIRAVPERAGMHAAWWVALVLAILLGVAIAWFWLRGTAPVGVAAPGVVPPQLALKLDPDIVAAQATVLQNPAAANSVASASASLPALVQQTETKGAPNKLPAESVQSADVKASVATTHLAPQIPLMAEMIAPARPTVLATPPTKKRGLEEAPKAPEAGSPVNLNKQVKELTPQQRAENEYRKATSMMPQGSTAETIAVLEQALQLDPLHASARQTLVGLLLERKRQDEAVRKLQEGLSLDPGQAGMAMILARLQVEKGELQPAVETLQRSLPYTQDRADYQAFLAALLQRQTRHKEAIEHYLIALRKTPQNGVWWMGLGISLQAENRSGEAQEAFGRAKATNTLSPELQAFVEQKLSQTQR